MNMVRRQIIKQLSAGMINTQKKKLAKGEARLDFNITDNSENYRFAGYKSVNGVEPNLHGSQAPNYLEKEPIPVES